MPGLTIGALISTKRLVQHLPSGVHRRCTKGLASGQMQGEQNTDACAKSVKTRHMDHKRATVGSTFALKRITSAANIKHVEYRTT